jgi:hypothetical protein
VKTTSLQIYSLNLHPAVNSMIIDSFDRALPIGDNSAPSNVCGRLAQLGERRVRNAEAGGSIPPPSTNETDLHFTTFGKR